MAKPGALVLPRPSRAYLVALGAVALVIALIPFTYLLLVGLVGWGVYAYAAHAGSVITTYAFVGLVLYLAPIVAGLVLIAFTLKPFLARRPAPLPPFTVTRQQEPRLFDFIDELCTLVNAPRPARIDLDLGANASAGVKGLALRRGDLIVSFGLPLAAVLDVQQLAAVLVHELAHCRQGTALRLHRVSSAINTWLARVVYERDAWDAALETGVKTASMLGVLLLPAILCVAATRRVLLWLVLAGHRASTGLSRRMEVEADRLSALVVGSEVATSTLRLVHGLDLAVARVDVEIRNALSLPERRLPDDAVACTQIQFETLAVSEWRQLDQRVAGVRTNSFDSHPAPQAREQAIRELSAPGLPGRSGPARALFDDLEAISRARTRHAYQHTLALTDGFDVVSAAEFSRGVRAADEVRLTLESFFGSDCVVTLDALPALCDCQASTTAPQPALDAALQELERLRPVARDAAVRFEAAFMQHARLLAASEACCVGASFEAEALGLARDDVLESPTLDEAISRALARNEEQRRRNSADVAPFRRAATGAVAAALAHLVAAAPDAPSCDEALGPGEADLLVRALNAFASHRTNLHDAQAHLQAVGLLLSLARPPDPGAAERGPAELLERAWELMAPTVEAVRALPVTPEVVRDPRVVECHHAMTSIDAHASQAFVLLPALYHFQGACLSRLLEALGLARGPRPRGTREAPARIPPPAPVPTPPVEPSPAPLTVVPAQFAFRRELLRRRPVLVATPLLVFVNVAAFALMAGSARDPAVPAADMLLRGGAAFRPFVVAGEWWRLFTASFLNAGAFRLAVTMAALAAIGKTAERVFGGTAFLAYYLVIGTVTALGCVLASDGLVFATAPAAVVGIGTATLLVAGGFVAGDRVPDRTGDVNRLDFPPETTFGLFLALVLVVIVDLPRDAAFGMYPLAAVLGAALARTTAFDAEFEKPAGRYVAALVVVAAVVVSLGVTYLRQRSDFRSEGFAWLANEERALAAFETRLRRDTWRGPGAVATLTPIVDGLLGEVAGAQVRARDMYARYLAVEARNRKLDRYGRNPNWRTWLATMNQLQIGWAYGDYLRSRESTWRARLRCVAEQRPDKLKELNRADAAARWALRNVLARPESANPP